MCDRAGLANCQKEFHPPLTYVHPAPPTPQGRHSSVQISTTSIIYFARVLEANFALRGRILQHVLPKILLAFMRRFLGMEGESMWRA